MHHRNLAATAALIASILTSLAGGAAADPLQEQKRMLYALTEAAPRLCPDMETSWIRQGALDYDMSATADEIGKYQAEEKRWLKMIGGSGRGAACAAIMQKFGPGADIDLFSYK